MAARTGFAVGRHDFSQLLHRRVHGFLLQEALCPTCNHVSLSQRPQSEHASTSSYQTIQPVHATTPLLHMNCSSYLPVSPWLFFTGLL